MLPLVIGVAVGAVTAATILHASKSAVGGDVGRQFALVAPGGFAAEGTIWTITDITDHVVTMAMRDGTTAKRSSPDMDWMVKQGIIRFFDNQY
jgi:hypothetical protein